MIFVMIFVIMIKCEMRAVSSLLTITRLRFLPREKKHPTRVQIRRERYCANNYVRLKCMSMLKDQGIAK